MNFRALAAMTLVALITILPAASQESGSANVYNIEIIVFRATQALGGAENWNIQTTRTSDAGETNDTSRNVGRFVSALPPSRFQLNDIENKLRTSGLYVPIAHVAWSQTASDWGTRAGFTVQKLGINVEGLNGTVFLERGMYLHLGMALSYAPANPPAGMGAGPGTTFQMGESRRIRFYERNYYDHPAFGVIALVTPAQGARPAGR
ncbi:MAG TPA: CsiV family protein [Steroidobacteraceae bacterium]|nr:CsiV family protein [Steroidobacteraceae bacterium]